MKRVLIPVLALVLVLALCACSGNGGSETTVSTTAPVETTAPVGTTVPVEQGGYTVKVVDEGGNPISGALVQLCKDSCVPTTTDENGVAAWRSAEEADGYKVSFLKLPDGYAYVDESVTDFYYGSGETEMTITLKAVA